MQKKIRRIFLLLLTLNCLISTAFSQLIVKPNMPRFLRQGDHIELSSRIVNMSDSELTGQVQLQLFDAATNQSVDGWFMNTFPNQFFTVAARQNEAIKFPIQVPFQFNSLLIWKIVARTNSSNINLSDVEENVIPVLSNKMLITKSLPLQMRRSGSKTFVIDKLLRSGNNESLQNHSISVEYASNLTWYAVKALPYLMEFPYECAEQTWNRYYSNTLASMIINSSPGIKQIVEQWKNLDTTAFLSNIQKNQELKSVLLEETPWVLESKSDEQQKKNIALLFDPVRMNNELSANLDKLNNMLSAKGGFMWFKGGPDDRYITQYIISGIGHLRKLKALTKSQEQSLIPIINKTINYLDNKLKEDYKSALISKYSKGREINYLQIQYYYMRSFFPEYSIPKDVIKAYNFYFKQLSNTWMNQNKYMQGMIALSLNRSGNNVKANSILRSLKETAIHNEASVIYWKDYQANNGLKWWTAPIETQSLLIEAFTEIGNDVKTANEMKTWLILNKQTNRWSTTKATADACYALLLSGKNWLENEPEVQIKLGNVAVNNTDEKTGAGIGYFIKTIDANAIKPEMGNITVSVHQDENKSSRGVVYWQYFEDMDKMTPTSSPLQLIKRLFVEKNTDKGPALFPVAEGSELHIGDKIKVQLEVKVDRNMEYVHLKDVMVSAFEPVNVVSEYKYRGRLGYYETIKDASSNFFFPYLPKGTYIFDYPLFVTHSGNFTNGAATIQCMYAPKFTAHSAGGRIDIEE